MRPRRSLDGFTLIELSIVLVIIGLIVGGILVGRDLIASAERRAFIGQIEKYSTAVRAFQLKYTALPGDISAASAAQFGMLTRAGTFGHGDGNGALSGGWSSGNVSSNIAGETRLFWSDLSFAQLIEGSLSGTDCDTFTANCPALATRDGINHIIPDAKLGHDNSIVVYTDDTDGRHYFQISHVLSLTTNGGGVCDTVFYADNRPITPQDAYAIDGKLDDGLPMTGNITTRQCGISQNGYGYVPGLQGANGTGIQCIYQNTNVYNVDPALGGDQPACAIRMPFN